jgi:serine/threonine protein kinase
MLDSGWPSAVGQRVPDYELLRRIGAGAYGEVWLARSNATGALRAAKIVWRSRFEDERPYQREFEGIQRFERISREHPSQLALFHIGRNDTEGYFYYVMELADSVENPKSELRNAKEGQTPKSKTPSAARTIGHPDAAPPSPAGTKTSDSYTAHTLRADLAHGRLPAARVLEIGLALSEALAHLHEKGLVHRDVKPSNVIFVNGRPKLADIGLVTDASDQCSIVGTEGYLPPEGPGTPQADIFALGKVLYEAATGLDRRSFPELPEDLRDWPEHQAVAELNEIVLRACAREAANRYSTCRDIHDELTRLGEGRSVKGRRVFRQRVRFMRKSGMVAVVAILTVAGALFLWRIATGYGTQVMVIGEEGKVLGKHPPRATMEYEAGLRSLRTETPEGYQKALEHLGRAIEIDPRFVEAYARLFETYLMSGDHGFSPKPGQTRKLNELAGALQSMAPTNADTHAAIAIVKFLNEWRWNEAEMEFKEAVKADKNCRMALTYYAYFLTRLRRSDDARRYLNQVARRYPESADLEKLFGHCEFAQRRFEDAMDHYQKAESLVSSYPSAYYWDARANMAQTNYIEAIRKLVKNEVLGGRDEASQTVRYDNYRKAVQNDLDHPAQAFWSALIDDLKPTESTNTAFYLFAARYVRVGKIAEAKDWLAKAVKNHDHAMESLLFDECWDPYRHEKWFKDVVKAVGLDPWQ